MSYQFSYIKPLAFLALLSVLGVSTSALNAHAVEQTKGNFVDKFRQLE